MDGFARCGCRKTLVSMPRGDDVLGCIAEYIAATDPPVVACGNPEPMAMGKPVRVPVRDPGEKFDSSVV
jgi:hypothetical protein